MNNKKSNLERAAEIGVSIPTLNSWKRCGVDIYDDEQVRNRIAKMRNIPPDIKPEWMPQAPPPSASADSVGGDHIESLKSQLSNCTDKHQAQTIKLKIDGALAIHKLSFQRGQFVSYHEMDKDGVQIGIAVASIFSRMPDDLAPLCAGRTAGEIKKIVARYARDKRTELSQYESRIKIPTE
jgi:hypothetical protein